MHTRISPPPPTFQPLRPALLAALLLATACASAPLPPTDALQAAELAIRTAEQARVADHASPELGEARDQLTAAQAAVQQENMVEAQRLAERSRLSAELATAKAEQAKARVVNEELQKGTDSLKQEMQRNTGAKQ
ncbi:MAG: DUF4398 domain-containing protein [Nevskiaceae bacterium]|nr:MAG: DUF4398 domain-containing protein [Nevskiaceae bacterium]TAM24852.1 MAG: DUF4398 domain-containing protein [Nevskiaceae bacterium]